MVIVILNNCIRYTDYYTHEQIDEAAYRNTTALWVQDGASGLIHAYQNGGENKPISFLAVQRILNADPFNTRLLNLIIILAVTILIYIQSKNVLAFLFPIFPMFLNSMWLTVEIFEALFLLLSLQYQKHSGMFIALAAIFRPYAILYALLLKGKQRIIFIAITGLFGLIMLYYGVLFEYVIRLIDYGAAGSVISEKTGVYFLVPMLILAISGNKTLLKIGILACAPLLFRTWAHYLIPAYTIFFLSYLQQFQFNTKNYIIKLKQYIYT